MAETLLKLQRLCSLIGVTFIILAEYLMYFFCYFLYTFYAGNVVWHMISIFTVTLLTALVLISFFAFWYSKPKIYSLKDKLAACDEEEKAQIIEDTAKLNREIKYVQSLISDSYNRIDENNDSAYSRYRCLDNKTLRVELQILKAISYTKNTWCFACEHVKPLQTHHCRKCGACIEQLDHHCYVIGRCIGRGNIEDFVRLLVYVFLASLIIAFNEVFLYFGNRSIEDLSFNLFDLLLLFNTASCLFFLALSSLFLYNTLMNYLMGVSGVESRNMYFMAKKNAKHSITDLISEILTGRSCIDIMVPKMFVGAFRDSQSGI